MITEIIPITKVVMTKATRPLHNIIPNEKFSRIRISLAWNNGKYMLTVTPLPMKQTSQRLGLCLYAYLGNAERNTTEQLQLACRAARKKLPEMLEVLAKEFGVHSVMPMNIFTNDTRENN